MALKKSSFSRNTFQQCKTICNRIKNISNIINWFIVNANLSKASYEEEEMKMANKGTSFLSWDLSFKGSVVFLVELIILLVKFTKILGTVEHH